MVSEKDQQQITSVIKYLKDVGVAQNIKTLFRNTNLSMSKLYQLMPMIVDMHPDLISYDEKAKSWKYIQAVTPSIE